LQIKIKLIFLDSWFPVSVAFPNYRSNESELAKIFTVLTFHNSLCQLSPEGNVEMKGITETGAEVIIWI
jgi:hypothetical protein